jgi:protocatechuate 3,4-dioxygenase beta subunit
MPNQAWRCLLLSASIGTSGILSAEPALRATLTPTFGWLDLPEYRGWLPGLSVPSRTSLLEPGIEGERLVVTGHVLTRHNAPVPDAKLEFWQADATGEYDRSGNKLRGVQRTSADGGFLLETIMPGYTGQIRHINYVATASFPGRKQPIHLSAAIYFATDDELRRPVNAAQRPYVRRGAKTHKDDTAFLPLKALPEDGIRRVSYDIVLDVD